MFCKNKIKVYQLTFVDHICPAVSAFTSSVMHFPPLQMLIGMGQQAAIEDSETKLCLQCWSVHMLNVGAKWVLFPFVTK